MKTTTVVICCVVCYLSGFAGGRWSAPEQSTVELNAEQLEERWESACKTAALLVWSGNPPTTQLDPAADNLTEQTWADMGLPDDGISRDVREELDAIANYVLTCVPIRMEWSDHGDGLIWDTFAEDVSHHADYPNLLAALGAHIGGAWTTTQPAEKKP